MRRPFLALHGPSCPSMCCIIIDMSFHVECVFEEVIMFPIELTFVASVDSIMETGTLTIRISSLHTAQPDINFMIDFTGTGINQCLLPPVIASN